MRKISVYVCFENVDEWRPLWAKETATVFPEFESGVFVFLGTSSDLLRPKYHIFWISLKKRNFWSMIHDPPWPTYMFLKSKNSSSKKAVFASLWQQLIVFPQKVLSFEKFWIQGCNQLIFFYLLEPLWFNSVTTNFLLIQHSVWQCLYCNKQVVKCTWNLKISLYGHNFSFMSVCDVSVIKFTHFFFHLNCIEIEWE